MFIFFHKQKTPYEVRISDWSSDVCSSDLITEYSINWYTRFSLIYTSHHSAKESLHLISKNALPYVQSIRKIDPVCKTPASILKIGRASCRERVCQYA